ncbi:MAG: SCO family protein [Alphaproteobacteria bacterium]
MNDEIKKRLKRTIILSLAALAVGVGIGLVQVKSQNAQVVNKGADTLAGVKIGGAFTLTDQNGLMVTEKSYSDKYKLVYFGFTMCPEVCPTGLQKIAKALNALGPTADNIQPIFITVDPDRDTPDALRQYVQQFHPRLVGLTGTKADIESVEKSYKVYAAKSADEGGTEYTMDHSAFTYFMDPDGNLLALYHDSDTAESMAGDIKAKLP